MQSLLSAVFPPHCVGCDARVGDVNLLCADCWRQTPFITGLVCDLCGEPLAGQTNSELEFCDHCIENPPPWQQGRAAVQYADCGRKIVLKLKHGNRPDIAIAAAKWLERAAMDMMLDDVLIVPVPLHWSRRVARRYNQSAELARHLSSRLSASYRPRLLKRCRATKSQQGLSAAQRFENIKGSIVANPRFSDDIVGRNLLLIDDVISSGATFRAATKACQVAGAASVRVLSLSRPCSKDYVFASSSR